MIRFNECSSLTTHHLSLPLADFFGDGDGEATRITLDVTHNTSYTRK